MKIRGNILHHPNHGKDGAPTERQDVCRSWGSFDEVTGIFHIVTSCPDSLADAFEVDGRMISYQVFCLDTGKRVFLMNPNLVGRTLTGPPYLKVRTLIPKPSKVPMKQDASPMANAQRYMDYETLVGKIVILPGSSSTFRKGPSRRRYSSKRLIITLP